ncbi:hypothetical protein GQ600_27140 [Phytophthora cactorum]|nr:hypothetical protein GQ600_27140 [Phytophthora cactorum]
MSPGDLFFGKPVMLQTYADKTLMNPEGTEAALVKNAGGEAACVHLVRNDDGTVSIKSMNNKHYLTVSDDDDGTPICRFDACEIKKLQKFHLKIADERTKLSNADSASSMLWVLREPTSGASQPSLCDDLGFTDVTPVQEATALPEDTPNNAIKTEYELEKRHDAVMKLAMAAVHRRHPLRLYGSTGDKEL